jgi:hypothetical protein
MLAFTMSLLPGRGNAETLPIQPIAQQTPEWCFAASASMIFQYLGYPNLNPGTDFQCGVVAAQGGTCMQNCASCPMSGGTMQRVALIMRSYAALATQMKQYVNSSVQLNEAGILTPQQIMDQISRKGPIMAGINVGQIPYQQPPAGTGYDQHAIVIVGYQGDANNFSVVVNDPYPYSPPSNPKPGYPAIPSPYLAVGGKLVQLGQYIVPYQSFVGPIGYRDSLTFR